MNFVETIFCIASAFLIAGGIFCLLGIFYTCRKDRKTGGKDK